MVAILKYTYPDHKKNDDNICKKGKSGFVTNKYTKSTGV